jgi:hypothetical protein
MTRLIVAIVSTTPYSAREKIRVRTGTETNPSS